MSTKRASTNKAAVFLIALVVILAAFLLFDGGTWIKGMTHGEHPMNATNWNWTQIIISLVLGFLIGFAVGKRK